mgnify:CR=1 FL=1
MSPRGRPLCTAILALVTLGLSLSACGGDEGGAPTLNWYVFDEPGGSFTNAAKNCSTDSYDIKVQVLPADADQQREQLVRRLAAGDTSIDLIGMDVIWTAEFAGAEWILPLEGKAAEAATKGKLEAAVESATYEDEVYGVPFTSNTQLLWYRKDLVKTPPTTWDEMLDMSAKLEQEGKPHLIQTQGQRYEGLTVLFNTVLASSGGSILNDDATKVSLEEEPTRTALEVLSKYARSDGAPDTLSTSIEDDNRLSFEAGESAFMLNYPFVYPSAEANAPEDRGLDFIDGARARHCRTPIDGVTLRRVLPQVELLVGATDISRWRGDLDYWVFADGELGQVDGRVSGPAEGLDEDGLQAGVRFRMLAFDRGLPITVLPPTR